jgi:hypothetical protein
MPHTNRMRENVIVSTNTDKVKHLTIKAHMYTLSLCLSLSELGIEGNFFNMTIKSFNIRSPQLASLSMVKDRKFFL